MGDSQRLCQVGQDLLVVPSRGISHHQRKANGAFKVTSPLLRLYGGSRGQLGQVCLAYLYSTLDTRSWVTLRQFVGPWKLFKVSSLFSSFVAPVLPILAIIFIHVLFRYRKSTHHALANCSYVFILQIIILQTVSIYLASYIRSSCKLHLFILQTVLLQIVTLFFPLQRWAFQYGFIARSAEVDFRSFSSVRAYFKGLSSDEVSQEFNASRHFSCM